MGPLQTGTLVSCGPPGWQLGGVATSPRVAGSLLLLPTLLVDHRDRHTLRPVIAAAAAAVAVAAVV